LYGAEEEDAKAAGLLLYRMQQLELKKTILPFLFPLHPYLPLDIFYAVKSPFS